jgi:hypothetical protein
VLRWNDCGRTRIERPRRSPNPSAGLGYRNDPLVLDLLADASVTIAKY